jgi:hypothetical protein
MGLRVSGYLTVKRGESEGEKRRVGRDERERGKRGCDGMRDMKIIFILILKSK